MPFPSIGDRKIAALFDTPEVPPQIKFYSDLSLICNYPAHIDIVFVSSEMSKISCMRLKDLLRSCDFEDIILYLLKSDQNNLPNRPPS